MTNKLISIVGKSNSGKTTLIEKLIMVLSERGYKVGTVKHAHSRFDIDTKGKDSWRHKNAGAYATLLISDSNVALIRDDITPYTEKIEKYLDGEVDIILVEGFKKQDLPKIEIFRTESGHKYPMFLSDKNLIAFVTNSHHKAEVPTFGTEDISELVDFIEHNFIV